ncbi:MAG: type II and III secretion system protein family protein [Pseudomonadota bacterium]|nr:type II and III secretion system protein family protein [Pseudomonadota bacterium]
MRIWARLRAGSYIMLIGLASVATLAQAYLPDSQVLRVDQGTHELLRQPTEIERVAVGDPSVADVNVINRREVLVTGKAPGITSLLIWGRNAGTPREYRVTVGKPPSPAGQLPDDPSLAQARVVPGQGLAGELPSLAAHQRARAQSAGGDTPAAVDASTVAIDTQVHAAIKIVEVSRTTLEQFGFNFIKNSLNTTVTVSPPGALSGIVQNQELGGFDLASGSGFRAVQDAFQLAIGDATNSVLGVISLLERRGLARTLAEPSLVAASGQQASFLAGGEFPIPVVQGNSNAVSVEFKEFGVRLTMSPTVLSADRIALKVAPEVSELDFNSGFQSGGVAVPGLAVRRTDTTIELGDGESFVISGLISNRLQSSVDKIPFLGDVPILGAFFRSSQYTRDERELIMVVTPTIVRPLAAGAQTPPLPGAELDGYRPGFGEFMLFENGRFDTGSGFSE